MEAPNRKMSAYGFTRQRIFERMKQLTASGVNSLPSLRDLADELGVSLMTVNKAVTALVKEGQLVSVPRKGFFIPNGPKSLEIGLLIDGLDSELSRTFFRTPAVLRGILDVLDRECACCIHSLHITSTEDLRPLVENYIGSYKLDACIWYQPESHFVPFIRDIAAKLNAPLMVAASSFDEVASDGLPPAYATKDPYGTGRGCAEFLLARGHRKIACFNACNYERKEEHKSFLAALAEAGAECRREWCVAPEASASAIPGLLDKGEVTAAVVNGGAIKMQNVLQTVGSHPGAGRMELLVDDVGNSMPSLLSKFPAVKVVGINRFPDYEIGVASARAVIDCVENGRPLPVVKIPTRIEECQQ